jgi:hypothetical protein
MLPFLRDAFLGLCLRLRLLLFLLREHDVGPHCQFQPTHYIITRMEEVAMLEHEDTATFGNHIYALSHIPRVECGRTTLERFLAILSFRVVEVQVERKVRPLLVVRRFVAAIAMRCAVSIIEQYQALRSRTLEVFSADIFEKSSAFIQPGHRPNLITLCRSIPSDVSLLV